MKIRVEFDKEDIESHFDAIEISTVACTGPIEWADAMLDIIRASATTGSSIVANMLARVSEGSWTEKSIALVRDSLERIEST